MRSIGGSLDQLEECDFYGRERINGVGELDLEGYAVSPARDNGTNRPSWYVLAVVALDIS
jgi:hypothetical protein